MVLLVACVPARRRAQGDVVRNIHFDGNAGLFSGQNDLQLRNQMEQESSRFGMMVFPLMYFTDPAVYVPEDLARDAYRLEVWYAHRGYLDAKVLGFATRRLRARGEKRAGIVDILGYVEPGEPSLVRAYDIVGTTPATGVWANLVKRTGLQRPGRQFDMLSAERDRALLELNLKDHGYAYADVTLALNAYPDEKAIDLELKMDPGQFTHIGEIEITGNKAVKEKFIRQNLRLTPGQPYRLDDLTAAQNRLFGMGTFSLVTVKPDLSDPTQTEVPIEVRVTENRFRTIRFGVGLRTHGVQNWEPAVQVRFKHSHLMYQLN